jgi:5-hydroxyisourate hydrolase
VLSSEEKPMTLGWTSRRSLLAAASPLVALAASREAIAQAKPSAGLTTHVLDTTSGKPAAGVRIDFAALEGDNYRLIKTVHTNADGRNDQPLLTAETMAVGRYQLVFYVAEYFSKLGIALPNPPFLDRVAIQFGISDATQHYHVPLLASPWSYTTYRGS